jgi:hypothetical protein
MDTCRWQKHLLKTQPQQKQWRTPPTQLKNWFSILHVQKFWFPKRIHLLIALNQSFGFDENIITIVVKCWINVNTFVHKDRNLDRCHVFSCRGGHDLSNDNHSHTMFVIVTIYTLTFCPFFALINICRKKKGFWCYFHCSTLDQCFEHRNIKLNSTTS